MAVWSFYSVPEVKALLCPAYLYWFSPHALWLSWQRTGHSGPVIRCVYSRESGSFGLILLQDPEKKKSPVNTVSVQVIFAINNKNSKNQMLTVCPYAWASGPWGWNRFVSSAAFGSFLFAESSAWARTNAEFRPSRFHIIVTSKITLCTYIHQHTY